MWHNVCVTLAGNQCTHCLYEFSCKYVRMHLHSCLMHSNPEIFYIYKYVSKCVSQYCYLSITLLAYLLIFIKKNKTTNNNKQIVILCLHQYESIFDGNRNVCVCILFSCSNTHTGRERENK